MTQNKPPSSNRYYSADKVRAFAMQCAADGVIACLDGPTGTGKTEAALRMIYHLESAALASTRDSALRELERRTNSRFRRLRKSRGDSDFREGAAYRSLAPAFHNEETGVTHHLKRLFTAQSRKAWAILAQQHAAGAMQRWLILDEAIDIATTAAAEYQKDNHPEDWLDDMRCIVKARIAAKRPILCLSADAAGAADILEEMLGAPVRFLSISAKSEHPFHSIETAEDAVSAILTLLKDGKRVAVPCDSKAIIDRLRKLAADAGINNAVCITATTRKEAQSELANPQIVNGRQLILFTEVVDKGVSYDGAIDAVIGIFANPLTAPRAAAQMMHRFRNAQTYAAYKCAAQSRALPISKDNLGFAYKQNAIHHGSSTNNRLDALNALTALIDWKNAQETDRQKLFFDIMRRRFQRGAVISKIAGTSARLLDGAKKARAQAKAAAASQAAAAMTEAADSIQAHIEDPINAPPPETFVTKTQYIEAQQHNETTFELEQARRVCELIEIYPKAIVVLAAAASGEVKMTDEARARWLAKKCLETEAPMAMARGMTKTVNYKWVSDIPRRVSEWLRARRDCPALWEAGFEEVDMKALRRTAKAAEQPVYSIRTAMDREKLIATARNLGRVNISPEFRAVAGKRRIYTLREEVADALADERVATRKQAADAGGNRMAIANVLKRLEESLSAGNRNNAAWRAAYALGQREATDVDWQEWTRLVASSGLPEEEWRGMPERAMNAPAGAYSPPPANRAGIAEAKRIPASGYILINGRQDVRATAPIDSDEYKQAKRPLGKWRTQRASYEQARAHWGAGNLLGVVPADWRLLVIDADTQSAVERVRRVLADASISAIEMPTRKGVHFAIMSDLCLVNAQLGEGVDLRSAAGYIVIGDIDKWRAARELGKSRAVPDGAALMDALAKLQG